MNASELKKAIQIKTMEFEIAMELGKTHGELKQLYQELKELQYKLAVQEASELKENQEANQHSHFSMTSKK